MKFWLSSLGAQRFDFACLAIFHLNFAIDFIVYCVSGGSFRRSVQQIILYRCCKNRNKLVVLNDEERKEHDKASGLFLEDVESDDGLNLAAVRNSFIEKTDPTIKLKAYKVKKSTFYFKVQ